MMSFGNSAMMRVGALESALATAGDGGCNHTKVKINRDIPLFSVVSREVTNPIGNFQPLDFDSDFGQKIIEGFNSFTGEAREVIIQQLEGLRAECASKDVKLLLGDSCDNPGRMLCATTDGELTQSANKHYIEIFISQKAIERQMNTPIYFIKKEGENSISIHAQPLRELVGDDVGKCAAYILVHEFSHVHSALHLSEGIKEGKLELKAYDATKEYAGFIKKYDIPENLEEAFKTLFKKLRSYGDDYRNTMGIVEKGGERIPGEFELLNALQPGAIRVYNANASTFIEIEIINALKKIVNKF